MKFSVWPLGLFVLAVPFASCKRREAATAPEPSIAANEAAPAVSTPTAPATASSATQTHATREKGATIDLQKVMLEAKPAIEARQRIETAREEVKAELDERKKRIQTLAETLSTTGKRLQNPALASSEREALVKEMNAKRSEATALEGEFKEFSARREKALNEKIRVELSKVVQDIHHRADALAKSEGYMWVMDRSGTTQNQVPAVVYVKATVPDLTAAVIRSVNEAAAKSGASK